MFTVFREWQKQRMFITPSVIRRCIGKRVIDKSPLTADQFISVDYVLRARSEEALFNPFARGVVAAEVDLAGAHNTVSENADPLVVGSLNVYQ
jgi:hypothetical protein